jgi:hypothetical protein
MILFSGCIFHACSSDHSKTLKPDHYESQSILTIESGDLKATFIDNSEMKPNHRSGYNGIAQLIHAGEDGPLFVPAFAGFNLEHIFGGDSLHQLFEPRLYPMNLFRKADDEVLLYQEATPLSKVESLTSFKVVKPHYIDINFQCIIHDDSFFRHGYAGFFWASYLQNPADKKIYFKGTSARDTTTTSWIEAWSAEHGVESTHRSKTDDYDFFFAPNFNASLASHFSEYRFEDPYYFGRFGTMVLVYMFDSDEIIRFSQSPTGGGDVNPAWDFQYIIPSPAASKKYSFHARIIYKPFVSNEDITAEFKKWRPKK